MLEPSHRKSAIKQSIKACQVVATIPFHYSCFLRNKLSALSAAAEARKAKLSSVVNAKDHSCMSIARRLALQSWFVTRAPYRQVRIVHKARH